MEYIHYIQEQEKYTVVANDNSKSYNNPQNRTDLGKRVSASTINTIISEI